MTRFDKCVEFILRHEGGYSDDKSDRGGETNFGISKRQFPSLDIRKITREDAKNIYRSEYWLRAGCDKLPNGIDLLVFDTAVNRGVYRALQRLQVALRVKADGIIGPQTRAAIKAADLIALIDEFTARRFVAYARLAQFPRYGLGWTRRIVAAHREALA
jgi:lysozyme family protein